MSYPTPTFTNRKYKDYWTTEGDFKGEIVEAVKGSKKTDAGEDIYFININVDGYPAYQYHDRWVEDGQQKTVNAFAMLTINAFQALGIDYDESEIANCHGIGQMIDLWNRKGIIGKRAHYHISGKVGNNGTAKLTKVKFLGEA